MTMAFLMMTHSMKYILILQLCTFMNPLMKPSHNLKPFFTLDMNISVTEPFSLIVLLQRVSLQTLNLQNSWQSSY